MFDKNPKLVTWFNKNLSYDPIKVLYYGYHAPIRYDLYKNYLLFEHDDEALIETEKDVKTAQRRVNLLLTLERILKNLHKFEKEREEEMLIKLASIVKELHFYNCNRKMTSIQRALAELIKYQNKDGSFPVSLAGNVFIIETILQYGVVNNPYMEKALLWLLRQQNADKGWGTTTADYSDIWLTTKVLHCYSYSMKYMNNTKIRKGIEFILSHLYVENPGGIVEGKTAWETFRGDFMLEGSYVGGILSVLEMCARLNVSYEDARVSVMLDWLKSKQLQTGHWPTQTFDIFNKRSDERVTMRVVSVLKLFYIMPRQGSATIKSFRIKQDGRTNAKKPGFVTDPENHPKPVEEVDEVDE